MARLREIEPVFAPQDKGRCYIYSPDFHDSRRGTTRVIHDLLRAIGHARGVPLNPLRFIATKLRTPRPATREFGQALLGVTPTVFGPS